ncbi:DNA polymerase subunit Cdc27, partial [Chytriomyces sp. MP71]
MDALVDALLRSGCAGDVVTWRMLSRKARVSAGEARRLLQRYRDAHVQHLHASFLVVGVLDAADAGSGPATVVKVVPQESVDEETRKYANCKVTIFSIAKSAVKDPYDVLANADAKILLADDPETMLRCHTIQNPHITYTPTPLFGTKAAAVANRSAGGGVTSVSSSSIKKSASKISSKPAATLFKQTSDAAPAPAPIATKKPTSLPKATSAATQRDFFATQIKRDTERRETAATVEAERQAAREVRAERTRLNATRDAVVHREVDARLMGMFDDEEDSMTAAGRKRGDDESEGEENEECTDHEVKRMKMMALLAVDPDAEAEAEREGDSDTEGFAMYDGSGSGSGSADAMQVDEEQEDPVVADTTTVAGFERAVRRVRRRRKVTRKVTESVGKYLNTKDVEGWESYSEEEVVPVIRSGVKVPVAAPSNVVAEKEKHVEPPSAQQPSQLQGKDVSPSKKTSPTKPKGKAGVKKGAPQPGQKLLTSFFKK